MEITKKCWLLLIAAIAIAWADSPDSITNENKIDTSQTVRQTLTFSQSNANGNIKRRQPIPRRAIRILDPNYVAKNFGTTLPGNNVNKNSNGIPSPYLVQQNDQESFNKVADNLSIVKNAYNSFIGKNDNSASKNNENFKQVSQSYDNKDHSQINVNNNQQYSSTSTTTDNIEENLILKKPSTEILTSSGNKNNNSFINRDEGQINDGFYEPNYFSEEKNNSQNSKDNSLYDYGGLLSQLTENDFKNFAINFASKEDIHTDSDDLNAFGLSLLSNDGLNSKRSVGVPLSQSEVVKRTPQDAIVLGKDNNQIIIAKENLAGNSNSGIPGTYGEPLPLNNLGSNDRSSQQFTIQGDFESFVNQGGSYSSSQSSSANNVNSHSSNQQQFITVRDGDSFETFGNNAASFGVPIPTPVNNNQDSINNNYNSKLESSSNQGGSVGITLPFTENYDFKQGDTTQNVNQGGTGIPLPSISIDNSNNNINYQDNFQGESVQSSNHGGTGIPLPSISSDISNNNNNIKYQDNVQGESIQSNNQGGSFGIPLPSSITGSAGHAQDNIQVDSVLKAINGFGSGNQENIEQMIGGMTIGQLLNGINGQNGIMVIPESSAPGLGIQIKSNNDQKISIREGSDEAVVIESSTTTTSAPETSAPRTRASRRRTTTPPPDHLRRSLSDLLYAKGQWFGTLIGGLIDYGQIVQEAYKKTLGADSRPPYGS